MSVLVQSSHWRSRHPAMLWVSVCLADTVTAIVLVISRLSDRPPGPESWLTLVIRVSSYSSIISVSSLSLDKMLSIARPFTYTLHRLVWSLLTWLTEPCQRSPHGSHPGLGLGPQCLRGGSGHRAGPRLRLPALLPRPRPLPAVPVRGGQQTLQVTSRHISALGWEVVKHKFSFIWSEWWRWW